MQVSPQEHLVISWNIEGVHRGFPSLVTFCNQFSPSLIFISEAQSFQCNIRLYTPQLPTYKFQLNGEDSFSPDLPMDTLRAKGGTMALWKCGLDPYVTLLPTTSSTVLPTASPVESSSVSNFSFSFFSWYVFFSSLVGRV